MEPTRPCAPPELLKERLPTYFARAFARPLEWPVAGSPTALPKALASMAEWFEGREYRSIGTTSQPPHWHGLANRTTASRPMACFVSAHGSIVGLAFEDDAFAAEASTPLVQLLRQGRWRDALAAAGRRKPEIVVEFHSRLTDDSMLVTTNRCPAQMLPASGAVDRHEMPVGTPAAMLLSTHLRRLRARVRDRSERDVVPVESLEAFGSMCLQLHERAREQRESQDWVTVEELVELGVDADDAQPLCESIRESIRDAIRGANAQPAPQADAVAPQSTQSDARPTLEQASQTDMLAEPEEIAVATSATRPSTDNGVRAEHDDEPLHLPLESALADEPMVIEPTSAEPMHVDALADEPVSVEATTDEPMTDLGFGSEPAEPFDTAFADAFAPAFDLEADPSQEVAAADPASGPRSESSSEASSESSSESASEPSSEFASESSPESTREFASDAGEPGGLNADDLAALNSDALAQYDPTLSLKELAQLGLAQGAIQIEAVGRPMHPMLIDEFGRFHALLADEGTDDPMKLAKSVIWNTARDIRRAALVVDARREFSDGKKSDAIVVMVCERGADDGETWAQRYQPRSLFKKFRIEGEPEVLGPMPDFITQALQAFSEETAPI